MNYGELRQNLISKGFAEESDLIEFDELGYTYIAINQALDEISDYFPVEAEFNFDIDENDTGIMSIDMADRSGFVALADDTPVWYEKDGEEIWRAFTEYDIKKDRVIVIKMDDYEGSFRIYYFKEPSHVSKDTQTDFIFDLPLISHKLIPLLTAYYLWLDDDERKAIMYKNDFQDALSVALQKMRKPKAKVMPSKWGDI